MTFEEFKDSVLSYLEKERDAIKKDIEEHKNLPEADKIEQGYLITDCFVKACIDDVYELSTPNNNTKLRTGDKIDIVDREHKHKIEGTIVENLIERISVTNVSQKLEEEVAYDVVVRESEFLGSLIQLWQNIEDGTSGTGYIDILRDAGVPTFYEDIHINEDDIPQRFNENQHKAIVDALKTPSLYCIQGPPGTGKTDVLAYIAMTYSRQGVEVLILSNTHQAVNNALNKIANYDDLPIIKIGETLKAQDLKDNIRTAQTYNQYYNLRKRKTGYSNGDVVGMTIHAAISNLGLRNSGFLPGIILVDEAGQVPLTFGTTFGFFKSSSIVLIGDDRQMPPIYHETLKDDPISISIFTSIVR